MFFNKISFDNDKNNLYDRFFVSIKNSTIEHINNVKNFFVFTGFFFIF